MAENSTPATQDCLFCGRVARGEYDDDLSLPGSVAVFEPLNPVTPGHLLVVPFRHVRDAAEQPHVTAEVMEHAARLLNHFSQSEPYQANIIMSIGRDATQSVFHLHAHIVPRHPGDGLHLPWTGQKKAEPMTENSTPANLAGQATGTPDQAAYKEIFRSLAPKFAALCAWWAQREGILEKVTEEEFAAIAKAFTAGFWFGVLEGLNAPAAQERHRNEPPADPETPHHQTVTGLRREITEDALAHREQSRRYRGFGRERTEAESDAHAGGLMAAEYGTALSAVLGVAQREFGPLVTQRLAGVADLILADGDIDGHNADVMPAEAGSAEDDEQRAADFQAHVSGMGGPSPAWVTDDAAGLSPGDAYEKHLERVFAAPKAEVARLRDELAKAEAETRAEAEDYDRTGDPAQHHAASMEDGDDEFMDQGGNL